MPSTGLGMIQLSFLQWLEAQESVRQDKYSVFRDYYEGEHATQLTARLRKFLELRSDVEFNLNLCPLVVDALAERLKVTGFQCDDNAELLWDWWQLSRMDAVQSVVHTSALRDGDTYLIVEWDEDLGRPRFSQENAYDGSEGVQVIYRDDRRKEPLAALKKWIVTSEGSKLTRRANLYYPDRIEKYTDNGGGGWGPFEEEGYDWPISWTHDGGPMGIPVVHFANRDQGYSYGESELEDVVPLVNAGNKVLIDLIASADVSALQMPWMTGGKPENMTFAPGSWAYSTNPEARIGVIQGANLDNLIKLKDSLAADIARVTRTPLSYFQITGQVAAEGTLKQQEAGLIAKAKDRAVVFGNSWEDALAMARKIANEFGSARMKEDALISAQWADPETRNELEHLNGLKVKAELGVPQETIWAEMGYSADDIERMKGEKAAEEASGIGSLAQALVANERQFNAG